MKYSAKFCGSKCKCYSNKIIEILIKAEVIEKDYTFRALKNSLD